MKQKLAKATLVVTALVGATVATVSTDAPPAGAAAGGAWPIDTLRRPPSAPTTSCSSGTSSCSARSVRYPPQTGPTITARALAVLHTAMYDAWAAYDPMAVGHHAPDGPPQQARQHGGDQERGDELRRLPGRSSTSSRWTAFPSNAANSYATPDVLLRALGGDPANTATDSGTPAASATSPRTPCSTTGTPTAPTSSPATRTPPATQPK